MSGLREINLSRFYAALRARGMTQTKLAALAGIGRSHLSQVLAGEREGRETWWHIIPALTDHEVKLLEQCSAWNESAEAAKIRHQASRGQLPLAS